MVSTGETTIAEFDALVARNQETWERDPRRFWRHVIALAAVGYAYLALLFLAAVAGLVVGGWLFWIMPPPWAFTLPLATWAVAGLFFTSVVSALAPRVPHAWGLVLSQADAPRLFAEVETLCARLASPRPRRVLLTTDFNASAGERPALGILGWSRRYLHLGVPLLKLVTPDECRAILAHEIGHFSRRHGRTRSWIYALHARWARLDSHLERTGGHVASARFVRWFAPRFGSASLVLCRAHELEADAADVAIVGPEIAIDALVRTAVMGRWMGHRFWPAVFQRLGDTPAPPVGFLGTLGPTTELPIDDARKWLAEALAVPTSSQDTHPSLRDRVRAIGCTDDVMLPPPVTRSASEWCLGTRETELVERVESMWREAVARRWAVRHQSALASRRNVESIAVRAATTGVTDEEEWIGIAALLEMGGDEGTFDRLVGFATRHPDHAFAQFELGRRLLDRDDGAGVGAL